MRIRTPALSMTPASLVTLDVAGVGIPLTREEGRDLACAIMLRAMGRTKKPSPVERISLSGTLGTLSLSIKRPSSEGFTPTIKVQGPTKAWVAFASLLAGRWEGTRPSPDEVCEIEFERGRDLDTEEGPAAASEDATTEA